MATTRTTALVAAAAFAAGASLAWLTASVREGSAPGAGSDDAPSGRPVVAPAKPAQPPRVERPRAPAADVAPPVGGPSGALPGFDVTEDEAAFLRKALDAERTRRRESSVRPEDDGLTVMRRYLTHGADVAALVADYDAMRAHVRVPEGSARRIDAQGDRTPVDMSAEFAGATVIEFGPGTFVLDRGAGGPNVRRDDVAALEIRGAGMDRTKLVGPGWAFLCVEDKASVRNLVIRDLTIDGSEMGQIVLDARGGISAALERVRLAGWQVAGHAAPLGVSGNAFLACRECEFVGPGDGFVLSLRGPALAAFDRCRFLDASSAFIGSGGVGRAAVVSLRDCTFDSIRLADSRVRGDKTARVTITVRGGTVAAGASSWTDERRREWWGAQYAAALEGVTFTAAKPLFPFSELVRAADLAAASGMNDLVAIEAFPGARGTPVEIDFYLFDRAKGQVVRRTRRLGAQALEEVAKEPRRGMRGRSVRSAADIDGTLAMAELLRRMQMPDDESCTQVELRAFDRAGEVQTLCSAQTPGGVPPVVVDARTGALLQKMK